MEDLAELLKFLVTPLLSVPDELVITQTGNVLFLQVSDTDIGRIIGKKGNVINALRTLLRTYSTVHHLSFANLQLQTPPKKD